MPVFRGRAEELLKLACRALVSYDALKVEGRRPCHIPRRFPGRVWSFSVLAGTGSFAIGRSPDGKTPDCRRLGPSTWRWRGSGYAIGLAGLRAWLLLPSEGRCEATALTGMALEDVRGRV